MSTNTNSQSCQFHEQLCTTTWLENKLQQLIFWWKMGSTLSADPNAKYTQACIDSQLSYLGSILSAVLCAPWALYVRMFSSLSTRLTPRQALAPRPRLRHWHLLRRRFDGHVPQERSHATLFWLANISAMAEERQASTEWSSCLMFWIEVSFSLLVVAMFRLITLLAG